MKIMKNKIITVLDFEIGRVFQYKVEDKFIDNGDFADPPYYEEYLTDKGHNLGNCEWMIHDIAQVITAEDYREVVMNSK